MAPIDARDARDDVAAPHSIIRRVLAAASSPASRARDDERASFSTSRLHRGLGYGAEDDADDGGSDVDGFHDASDVVMFASDASDAERGSGTAMTTRERTTTRARGPSRALRAGAGAAVGSVLVLAAIVGSRPRGTTSEVALSVADEADAREGWERSDASSRASAPGGWRLPANYVRSEAWRTSEYASLETQRDYIMASLGRFFGLSGRLGSDPASWDPTTVILADGATLPKDFDVREKWPKCAALVSEALDQGECGSCWAVAPAKVMADRLCIATNGAVASHLSAMQLLSCGKLENGTFDAGSTYSGSCDGGFPNEAYEKARTSGIVSGGLFGDDKTCMPYAFAPCQHPCNPNHVAQCPTTCRNKNVNLSSQRYEVTSLVTCGTNDFNCMALELFNHGPVSSYVGDVFDEFYKYKSGVYSLSKDVAARGENHGGHVMEVIGWGTTESGTRYWKVYNSWLNWGDQGYGKIAVGELSIGESIEAVRMSTTSGAAATTSKTRSS